VARVETGRWILDELFVQSICRAVSWFAIGLTPRLLATLAGILRQQQRPRLNSGPISPRPAEHADLARQLAVASSIQRNTCLGCCFPGCVAAPQASDCTARIQAKAAASVISMMSASCRSLSATELDASENISRLASSFWPGPARPAIKWGGATDHISSASALRSRLRASGSWQRVCRPWA
jgi:hypothetical protein